MSTVLLLENSIIDILIQNNLKSECIMYVTYDEDDLKDGVRTKPVSHCTHES